MLRRSVPKIASSPYGIISMVKHSFLCEKHFSEDCFQPASAMAPTIGISWRKKLNLDAIPTIFESPEPTGTSSVASDSGDAATFSRKRTTAKASNSTSVTDS